MRKKRLVKNDGNCLHKLQSRDQSEYFYSQFDDDNVKSIEDWSRSFDDMDEDDWEKYMGGPDDEEQEFDDNNTCYHDYDDDDDDDDDEFDYDTTGELEEDEDRPEYLIDNDPRKRKIVKWLAASKLSRKFVGRMGFFVIRGPNVRLKDGTIMEVLNWLFEEDIIDGQSISGYTIVHTKASGKNCEKLSFFRVIVDAPFYPRKKQIQPSLDDDIPF